MQSVCLARAKLIETQTVIESNSSLPRRPSTPAFSNQPKPPLTPTSVARLSPHNKYRVHAFM